MWFWFILVLLGGKSVFLKLLVVFFLYFVKYGGFLFFNGKG